LPLNNDGKKLGRASSAIRPTIGLSPIVFNRPGSWPTAKTALFDRYWREFVDLVESLLSAGYSIRLFVTDAGDYNLAKILYNQLKDSVADKENFQLFPLLKLQELITLLRTCDVVIASRLHGVLLSHVSGVPALGISYHRKVRVHMEDMGQEKFSLDFETFTASEARDILQRLLAERSTVISEVNQACGDRYMDVEKEFIPIGTALASQT
jgi:polysaccharide pyruvyl transferase WcaK-like protein